MAYGGWRNTGWQRVIRHCHPTPFFARVPKSARSDKISGVLAALLLFGLLTQAEGNEPPHQLSVAEAVNNAEANGGHVITVEGLLLVTDEVTALKGDGL